MCGARDHITPVPWYSLESHCFQYDHVQNAQDYEHFPVMQTCIYVQHDIYPPPDMTFVRGMGKKPMIISDRQLSTLMSVHSWPGDLFRSWLELQLV